MKRFALVSAAVVLALAGCASEQAPVPASVQSYYDEHVANAKPSAPASTPTAAPVAVSIISDSHAYNAGSWFRQTVEAGKVPGAMVGAFASQPGASAAVLAAKLGEATKNKGVVIVQAGTNDLLAATGAEKTAENVEVLAEGVRDRGGKPVLALIPPSATRGPEVVATNKLLTAYAGANKVGLLDLTTGVTTADGKWKEGLSDDGTHANAAGAKIMADAAAQQLPALLR